jgi:hypothetical protein
MRKLLLVIATFVLLFAALWAQPASAQNLPKRAVIVVADGLNPQLVNFGTAYSKTAFGADAEVAFDGLADSGKTLEGDALASMKNLLLNAGAKGYRTGLVTTGDVSKIAPLFYGDAYIDAPFSVIAGGGRASFADGGKAFADKGNSAWFSVEAMDEEAKGKILALQSDAHLSYSIDRDVEKEAGFSELATLALQTLTEGEQPFILVIHDTLLGKALAAKDTPAVLAQWRELDGIIADAKAAREENAELALAVVGLNAQNALRFTTELPNQRSDAFYTISALPVSYTRAGTMLQGADEAKVAAFATESYKGWKLSDTNKTALLKGELTGEAAIRASYEPALKIAYDTMPAATTVWTLGWPADFAASLK